MSLEHDLKAPYLHERPVDFVEIVVVMGKMHPLVAKSLRLPVNGRERLEGHPLSALGELTDSRSVHWLHHVIVTVIDANSSSARTPARGPVHFA